MSLINHDCGSYLISFVTDNYEVMLTDKSLKSNQKNFSFPFLAWDTKNQIIIVTKGSTPRKTTSSEELNK
jgi:hypothetical protein